MSTRRACFRGIPARNDAEFNCRRLLVVAIAAAILWAVATWFVSAHYYDQLAVDAIETEALEAERQAVGIGGGIDRILAVRQGMAITLAEDETIRQAMSHRLRHPEAAWPGKRPTPSLARLNQFLGAAEQHLQLDALWIGDANGYGIAAKSANPKDSPIGINYSDRIYFQEAKAGRAGYQYAVGRTTGLGGVFFSAPVLKRNVFAGFVVTKINTSRLSVWLSQADALLSDDLGVIVLAKDKRLEMRTLPGAAVDSLSSAEKQRQYAQTEFRALEISEWQDARYSGLKRIDGSATPVLLSSYPLPEFGLTVTVLRPVANLAAIDNKRMLVFLAATCIGVLLLSSLVVSILYLRRLHDSTRLLAYQKQQLDEAQQMAHLGNWEFDVVHNKVNWSEESRRIFELPAGRYSSTYEKFLTTIHPDDRDTVDRTYRESVAKRLPGEVVHRLSLASGQVKLVHERWQTQYDEDGKPVRSHGSVQDVTESRQVESRLRLAASVFDNANEGICITDAEQRIIDVNPTLCELTGFSREEVIGQTPRAFKSDRQAPGFYAAMWQAIATAGHWRGELWNRRRNGEYYAVRLTVSAVRDPAGKVTNYIGIMVNITASKRHMAQLERVAHFDALTGIPNRLLLADRMRQAIAQTHRGGTFLAICYLDLDEFKPINDTYGHDTGDLVLTEVAHRISACLRGGDTVARLGGDEFALLLLGLHRPEEYEATMHRILEEIAAPLVIGGHALNISASIGVVLCPQQGSDQDTLLRHADRAMYRAKQAGKNRWYMFDPDDHEDAQQESEPLTAR